MKSTRRIHLSYIVAILAILSLGATFAARNMLQVITSPADVTGAAPEIRFLDDDAADQDWEIETDSLSAGFFEISLNNSNQGTGMFKIHEDSDEDLLTLDANGNIAINGETAETFNEVEVYGNTASDTFAALAITPTQNGASARMTVSTTSDAFRIGVNDDGTSFLNPFSIDLNAPNNALSIASDGDVGIGVSEDSVAAGVDLHIAGGGAVLLDAAGTTGDWTIDAGTPGLEFENGGTTVVQFDNGAPADSLVVAGDGSVGVGSSVPSSPLHILRSDGTAAMTVEETSGTVAVRQMMNLQNNGGIRFSLDNTAGSRWDFNNDAGGNFSISVVGTGGSEFRVTPAGQVIAGPGGLVRFNLTPAGNLIIQGALTQGSDRDIKENFQAVDCDEILAKVSELPVTTWNYKHDEDEVRHIGPVAQDFRAAFGLGHDDVSITTLDTDGVALASIKALNQKLEREAEEKDAKIATLEERLQAMEKAIEALTAQQ